MKVIGIDELEYEWKYELWQKPNSNPSSLHLRARVLLKKIYPFSPLSEEIPLPGTFKERLYLDFFVPKQQLAIEVQGEQHYEYNEFFFGNKQKFSRAMARDRSKVEWCKINNIKLVELPYNESDREWEIRIRNR